MHDLRKRRHGDRDERDLGLAEGLLERAGGLDGFPLGGDLERRAILVPAGDVRDAGPPGREARRGADEPGPDDGQPHVGTVRPLA